MSNTIELKLVINGKEAITQISLTDEALRHLNESLKAVCKDAEFTGNVIYDGFTRARNVLQGLKETFMAVQTAFGEPLKLAVQYEQYETAMRVMLGSADAAKERMKELEAFAASTPFQLSEVVQLGMQLQSIQQYSIQTITLLGDLAAASGKSIEQVFNAYAKLATGQIGEAKRMFQDVLISESDWQKALNAKGLSETAENMMLVLTDIIAEKGFAGMMNEMSKQMTGRLSNLQDAITRMQRSLGEGVAYGLAPFIENMTIGLNSLNEFSPALSGVLYGIGAMTVSLSLLNATGLLPMIINQGRLTVALQNARVQFQLAASSGHVYAGAMQAAGTATKGFFASLGPVGWAILGITALTTAIGMFAENAEQSSRELSEYQMKIAKMDMGELEEQLQEQQKAIQQVIAELQIAREEYNRLTASANHVVYGESQIAAELYHNRKHRESISAKQEEIILLSQKQHEIESRINEIIDQQERLRRRQAEALKKQLEIDLLKSDKEKQLRELEQQYQDRLKIAGADQQMQSDIERWYKIRRTEIIGASLKKQLDEERQYQDRLNALRLQSMQDGMHKELQALQFWYEEQRRLIRAKDSDLLIQARSAKEAEIKAKYADQAVEDELSLIERRAKLNNQSEEQILSDKLNYVREQIQAYRNQSNETLKISQKMYQELVYLEQEYQNSINRIRSEQQAQQINNAIQAERSAIERYRLNEQIAILKSISDKNMQHRLLSDIDLRYLDEKKKLLQYELQAVKNNASLETSERVSKEEALLAEIASIELQIVNIKQSAAEKAIEEARREAEVRRQLAKQVLGDTASLFGQIYSRRQESVRQDIEEERKRRIEVLETERKKRLEHAVTQQEKDRINQEYDAKLKQMEEQFHRRQKEAGIELFNMQKGLAIVQAIINTAESATKAYAQGGAIFGPALAAMITALGMAQVAFIASQEPPGYAKGGLFKGFGGSTDDQNLIRISNGEFIVNAEATQKNLRLLEAINANREIILPLREESNELINELRSLRYDNKKMLIKQITALSKINKIKAIIDKHDTTAIFETANNLIHRRKA